MPPTYYRGCWHVVSRDFLDRYRHFLLPCQQRFTIRRPSSLTRRRWVRLSPIAQYSPLLPPVGVWTVLSSNVAVQPLSPATDRRLGGPLPRQLSNQTRAHLCTTHLWYTGHATRVRHPVLAVVSNCYPGCKGRLLTRYSPVRH